MIRPLPPNDRENKKKDHLPKADREECELGLGEGVSDIDHFLGNDFAIP